MQEFILRGHFPTGDISDTPVAAKATGNTLTTVVNVSPTPNESGVYKLQANLEQILRYVAAAYDYSYGFSTDTVQGKIILTDRTQTITFNDACLCSASIDDGPAGEYAVLILKWEFSSYIYEEKCTPTSTK